MLNAFDIFNRTNAYFPPFNYNEFTILHVG